MRSEDGLEVLAISTEMSVEVTYDQQHVVGRSVANRRVEVVVEGAMVCVWMCESRSEDTDDCEAGLSGDESGTDDTRRDWGPIGKGASGGSG